MAHVPDPPASATGDGPAAGRVRLARWEHAMRLPLALSAVLPLAIGMTRDDSPLSVLLAIVSWLVFVLDLAVHLRLSSGYLRTGFGRFDLAIVVLTAPWFLIPALSGSGYLMLARLGRLGRLFLGTRLGRTLMARLGRVGVLAGSSLLVLSWIGYQAERDINPEFADVGDALWWGIVTMTTVGYGDIVPETTNGRVAGTLLMITGLGVLGSLAGILASFLRVGDSGSGDQQPAPGDAPEPAPAAERRVTGDDLAVVQARLAELQEIVARLGGAAAPEEGDAARR